MALDGTYTYTFTLSENLDATSTTNIEKAYKKGDSASIGDSVDFRGIPYYMSQLNEFIRTFSANVNQLQNAGYDKITLTTFGFQAPEFYKKLGYIVEFIREDKNPKLCKYFLSKRIIR